jgi:phosphoribosylamine--glycine ligase
LIRIAVLVSGGGTNLQALIDVWKDGKLAGGELSLVISSAAGAGAIERAKNAGIKTVTIERKKYSDISDFDAAIAAVLSEEDIGLVVLAGFLSVVGKNVLKNFENKIINVHPSLIPSFCGKGFYGLHVHKAVIEKGVKVTGATVHFVNDVIDGGKIILQKAVNVLPDDTPESLQKRVMREGEWVILPQAVEMFCKENRKGSSMKVLVVGGGGREHAIIKALKKSARNVKLYAAPGNGGISRDAECVPIKALDIRTMTEFVLNNAIDYVVVAPDDPLALGMVDALEEKGVRCFGPNKAAARIESSKVFSKNLMKKYNIPTAAYETFSDSDTACVYVKSNSVSFPLVIKADGLALGKGVIIAENRAEAINAIETIMLEKQFGSSGLNIVIEEYLTGPEVTVLAFTDGKTVVPMVSSMDHKRIFDGNTGPNTGGMGVIAPNPHYTDEIAAVCEKTIFLPSIRAMQEEGCPFKGCLYFGLMLTRNGPMVIEYNCRFGDPETQAVLPLLETDLLDIMEAVTDGRLSEIDIRWSKASSVCLVLASGGYPGAYNTGLVINGLAANGGADNADNVTVYHAGTNFKEGSFLTTAGRVLGVSAAAPTLKNALEKAYKAAGTIDFEGVYYRRDIGKY